MYGSMGKEERGWRPQIAISTGLTANWFERIPGKVSGRPLVRGTRILAVTIVQDAELGSPLKKFTKITQICR